MTPNELQNFLRANIPLVGAMQVSVASTSDEMVALAAPLEPNINHQGTGFGGSIAALAVLAGWSLVHCRLRRAGIAAALVIRRSELEYEQAVTAAFSARATFADERQWASCEEDLLHKAKGRSEVVVELECEGQVVGRFRGLFVALRK